jgi:hypothetical protein
MLDVVLSIVALVAGGLIVELFAAARAPLGYEDESGFHLGIPVQQGPDVSVLSVSRPKVATAHAAPVMEGQLVTAGSASVNF